MHSMAAKVGKGAYSNALELTKMTLVSKALCQANCMLTLGCVLYNFNDELSACHFADPLHGSITDKLGDMENWLFTK